MSNYLQKGDDNLAKNRNKHPFEEKYLKGGIFE
jgi:hypothetical protein